MDANDRNESTIRERDARLARRLGEALDQLNPRGAGNCPDAEVIAAYSERALGADDLASCENHFATCGRCRNILKVLAAASDALLAETEVAQLGQRVSAVRAPTEITEGVKNLPRSKAAQWSTRWLAPAFGIAAVLTVWLVIRPPWRAADQGRSETLIAQAPREESQEPPPLAADRSDRSAPGAPSALKASPAKPVAPGESAKERARDELKSKDALQQFSPDAGPTKSLSNRKKEDSAISGEEKPKTVAAPRTAPSPSQPAVSAAINSAAPAIRTREQADPSAATAPATPLSTSQSGAVSQVAPVNGPINPSVLETPPKPESDLPINGRRFQALNKLSSIRAMPLLLKSALGATIWRAGAAGAIERSTDAGNTWSPQVSPSRENWLAGAAISDTVCWLAGRNGAIARTVDGKNWQSVAAPSQAAAKDGTLPDWTGIAAQNTETAVITAADGAKFATSDGGKTWQRQP